MTHLLPPNLLRLFVPRPPLSIVDPLPEDTDPAAPPRRSKKIRPLQGVAAILERVKQEAADKGEATEVEEELTYSEQTKREMRREEKKKMVLEARKRGEETFDPSKDPEAQGDPFTTLFLSRLPYETSEKDLQREFGVYGPIERIRVVRDKEGKSRGYAFLVYEKERDMRTAYKEAEGIKIGGRRIMVDVERGRTVKDWKPMRLGGGLGGATRKKKEPEPVVPFAAPGAFRGGFGGGRGGFRGGMRGGFAPRGGGFMGGAGRGGAPGGFGGPPGGGGFGAPRGGGGFGGPPGPGMGRGGFAQRGGFGQQSQMGGPPGGGYGAPSQGAGGGYVPRGGFGGGGGYGGGHEDGPPAKRGRY